MTETDRAPVSTVVAAACPSYAPDDVGAALDEALAALGGLATFIRPGDTVLLKANLFRSRPPGEAVTTHPEIVRQVALRCHQAGAARVWVGDSVTSGLTEAEHWARTGMASALQGSPAELKSWDCRQVALPCGGSWLAVPEWFQEVDAVISLPKLKAHNLTVMTCATKNVFGIISGHAKTQFHLKNPSTLEMSDFLVDVYAALKPRLSLADAVITMEGNGPVSGTSTSVGVILASSDAVALDAIACQALKIAPISVPMLRIAAERGLGRLDESHISCLGSGLSRLSAVHMKPSLARWVRLLPPWACFLTPLLFSLRPRPGAERCARCGICVQTCPRQALHLLAAKGPPAVDRQTCGSCLSCVASCPNEALSVGLHLGPLRLATFRRRAWYPR